MRAVGRRRVPRMLSAASQPSERLRTAVAEVTAAPDLAIYLHHLSTSAAEEAELQVLGRLASAIDSTFAAKLQNEATICLEHGLDKDAATESPTTAAIRRAEWTLALGIGCNALAVVRQEALEVLKDAQRDQLFWRQRVGAPLQELIEQGPWGWVLSLQGSAPATPSSHAKQLAELSAPLFVAVGAVTRARDLALGTLDFCANAASAAMVPIPSPMRPGPLSSAPRHTARRTRRADIDGLAQVAHGAVAAPLGGASSAGHSAGLSATDTDVQSRREDDSLSPPCSPLFSARGRPVTAMVAVVAVVSSSLRACVATLAACSGSSPEAKRSARRCLDNWTASPHASLAAPDLIRLLQEARAVASSLVSDIRSAAALHRRRWGPLRNWHRLSAVAIAAAVVAAALWRQRNNLGSLASGAATSVAAFVERHLVLPATDMAQELLSGEKRTVSDAGALRATRRSLQAILSDYYSHNPQVLSAAGEVPTGAGSAAVEAAAARLAAVHDVGPAEQQFAEEMRRPVLSSVAGTLPQLVLMQMAKLRVEALTLMNAMDGVIKSNDFTARMAAVMPVVAITASGLYLFRMLGRAVFRPIPTDELKHAVLLCVRDIDRLLSLAASSADVQDTLPQLRPSLITTGRRMWPPVLSPVSDASRLPAVSAATLPQQVSTAVFTPSLPPSAAAANDGEADTEQPPPSPVPLAPGALTAGVCGYRVDGADAGGGSSARATPGGAAPQSTPQHPATGSGWTTPVRLATTAASAARRLRRASSIGSVGAGNLGAMHLGSMHRARTAGPEKVRELSVLFEEEQHRHPEQCDAGAADGHGNDSGPKASSAASPQSWRRPESSEADEDYRTRGDATNGGSRPLGGGDRVLEPPLLDVASDDALELQGGLHTLTLEELGSLELRIERLRELLTLLSAVLHEEEVARLDEDLADLAADDLSAAQRLDILRRMRCTYAFLTPVHRDEPLMSLFGLRMLG